MGWRALGVLVLAALTTLAGTLVGPNLPDAPATSRSAPSVTPSGAPSPVTASPRAGPLAGVRIGIDPGHQLGNRNFTAQINARVPAGGFTKACNTTGTATDAGFPEATFAWEVARRVQRDLQRLGAVVLLTREANSNDRWGPCVDERGKFGARVSADLVVSLHADGAPATDSGFHVITPRSLPGFTDDIASASARLGQRMRAGLESVGLIRSTYVAGGLNERADLGTLNLSDVPIVMLELGNMRNPSDAARMASAAGQDTYARGVVAGIRAYLR